MNNIQPLLPQALRQYCDPEQFAFETTADLEPLTGIIGQERATAAVSHLIDKLRQKYADQADVTAYLDAVQQDVVENDATEGTPVIYEDHPT